MIKLFSLEDTQLSIEDNNEEVNDIDSIQDNLMSEIEDAEDSFNVAIEGIKTLQNQFNLITNIRTSLESKKLASVDYFISIENLTPVMKSIANNLGVKYKVPSLEDFKNPYSIETCHQIAMEGFVDFMRKIWEKIKEFLISLLKKIQLFFNRLTNADLQLEQYEEYVDKMMTNIKSNKYVLSNNKAVIESKLPSMLGKDGMERMDTDYLINYGIRKLDNLSNILMGITIELPNIIKNMSNQLEVIIRKHNDNILKDTIKILDTAKDFKRQYRETRSKNETSYNYDAMKKIMEKIIDSKDKNLKSALGEINNNDLISIITSGRKFASISSLDDLPDKVFDKIQYSLNDDTDGSNVTMYKLFNNKSYSEELPYSYNVYLIIIENTVYITNEEDANKEDINENSYTNIKYIVVTNKESIATVANQLYPLESKEALIELYNKYKTKYSKVNIKSVGKAISANSKIEDILDKSKKYMIHIADIIDEIEDICIYMDIAEDLYTGEENKESLPMITPLIEKYQNERKNTISEIRKYNAAFNKYSNTIIGALQFITQFMKAFGYDTASTYLEVKYEVIKYIYNNCRLYVKE